MSGNMTKEDVARIQSANDKSGNDPGFKARAQAAADKAANEQGKSGSKTPSSGKK